MQLTNYNKFRQRYKTLKRIGSGSFGEVYSIYDNKQHIHKVMKYIKKPLQESNKTKIINQAKLMEKLSHPQIVKIYEYLIIETPDLLIENNTNQYLYIIMEKINGNKLSECLGKLNQQKVINIYKQIKSAIQYLQKNQIIHRDISLDNILIDDNYQIKLIDFGIATQLLIDKDYYRIITNLGKPKYIAPQIFLGVAKKNSDLWALGIVIIELIFGKDITELYGHKPGSDQEFPKKFYQMYQSQLSYQIKNILVPLLQRECDNRLFYQQKVCKIKIINKKQVTPQKQFPEKEIINELKLQTKKIKIIKQKCENVKKINTHHSLNNQIIQMKPQAYYNTGLIYQNKNQIDQAIQQYSHAITLDHKYTKAYLTRGILYFKSNNIGNAISDFNDVIKLDPNNSETYYNRALIYSKLNEIDKALEDYSQAIKLNKEYKNAYANRGELYLSIKQLDKALDDYNKVIKLDPKDPVAYYKRGLLYQKINNFDKNFKQKDKNSFFHNRGSHSMNIDQIYSALSDYSTAIKLNRNYTDAYFNRALIFHKLKKQKQALSDEKIFNQLKHSIK